MKRHDHPGLGWAGVAALVVVADYTGNRTMSEVFRAASKHPVGGPAVVAGWAVLTAHLFGLIDPRYDPFHMMGGCTPRRCPHARSR